MTMIFDETIQDSNTFLTNFATGYKLRNPVADWVSPPFKVKLEAGKYAAYDKSVFRIYDDKIIGEEPPKEIQWNVEEETYSCEEYAMGKFISDKKKAQSIKPINLETDTVKMLKRFHSNAREFRINAIAGNVAVVTQTDDAGGNWDAVGGTPIAMIREAIATIELATGEIANSIMIPSRVGILMTGTTEWTTYFGGFDIGFAKGLWNVRAGLKNMGLDVEFSNVMGLSTSKGTASDPKAISMWGDSVLVFHREPNPTMETRTFMYSPYVKKDVMFRTRMPRRRGVYIDIWSDIDELLVDAECAYLITNTL